MKSAAIVATVVRVTVVLAVVAIVATAVTVVASDVTVLPALSSQRPSKARAVLIKTSSSKRHEETDRWQLEDAR